MARNQLDNHQLEVMRDIADDVDEADFVPYACLYEPHTILTKNGELIQIVKITGFTYEVISNEDADLRNVIREAVAGSIQSDDYALWFTTIRRKKSLNSDVEYPDAFSAHVHDAWRERNEWDRKYINELYITIVREGQNAEIKSAKGFVDGVFPMRDRKIRNRYLEGSAQQLNQTVDRMLSLLQGFGAQRLSIVKRGEHYYGEHLEFLEKLINLEERPMPLTEQDLSDYLTSGEISFAYNAMEVRTASQHRRFGAILTVKEYKEASLYRIDEFLQIPCEFIVTQCIDFVNAQQALDSFQDQYYYLRVSGDGDFAQQSELTDILRQNRQLPTDYGEQQTTIFVINESVAELEHNIRLVRENLADNGMVVIREDLKFEECYWSQLPANFEFIARSSYTHTSHVAGFVNIQNYPGGNAKGCLWGPPVTLFYTAAGTPYFFNFHLGNQGHTSVIGPYGSGKSVLINFLIAESRKYRNRLFYLDAHAHAKDFVEAIGGKYYDIGTPQASAHHLSPLNMPDSEANREFLGMWLATLIDPTGEHIDDRVLGLLSSTVHQLYASGEGSVRTLELAAGFLAAQGEATLADKLAPWYGQGEYAGYFDHAEETVVPQNGMIGFNLQAVIDDPVRLVPIACYLFHRLTMTLDGTPTIFVLDEAWRLFNNPLFAPRVTSWMEHLTSQNAFAIFATENAEEAAECPFGAEIVGNAVTQIYLPNEEPDECYADVFGLTDEEFTYLDAMNVQYRHFLLKRGNESIVAELNLGGMKDVLAVLSGNVVEEEEAA